MQQEKAARRQRNRLLTMAVAAVAVVGLLALGLWIGLNWNNLTQPVTSRQPTAAPAPGSASGTVQPPAVPTQASTTEQYLPASASVPIGDNPRLTISEAYYNFGSIPPDKPVERTLTVGNAGPRELVISEVTSNCGCTTAPISSKNIPPGGKAEIKATYDPRVESDAGYRVMRYIDVKSNDPLAPLVRIVLEANVLAQ
jgi:cytoskeletal protein RodZ